ncbi:MAG: GNAT family N-acetyltransferase [Chromatiales bacterium]|nr:GNAT family N-acetyltransferase [Chromatiales bacterium]
MRSACDEYGVVDATLLALQRTLRLLSPDAVLERLYIVAQPVPRTPAASLRRGQAILVRPLLPGDPALAAFTRIPAEVTDRFAQGAVCLGAFRGTELLGWLWFTVGAFRDHTHPVAFELAPPGTTAWDFDVYVRPEARLTAAFARLWEAAFDALRDRGVNQTLSAISAYNPASLRAHRRLGTTPFGSLLVLRLGRLQAVFSRHFRPHSRLSFRADFRATFRLDAPGRIPESTLNRSSA